LPNLNRYEALEKVGEGGMSTVYKGRHRVTGEIVALKLLSQDVASKPVLVKRFEQEFQTASRLDHPNIVRSLDFGRSALGPYLVMEFVDGMSLGERIEQQGRLQEAEAVRLITQIAEALQYAHGEGIIHRDIKPDNILLDKHGQAMLTDLGLVKQVDDDMNLTRPGQGLGTPNFMAPEQFSSAKTIDRRCDVYGLGATLYQAITGQLPFAAASPILVLRKKAFNELTPPRRLVPGLSELIERATLKAMSVDPNQRPPTAAAFIEELKGNVSRRPAPSAPADTPSAPLTKALPKTQVARTARPIKAKPAPIRSRHSASVGPVQAKPKAATIDAAPFLATSDVWQWLLAAAIAVATAVAGFFAMDFLK
jgi:serine/threonine protein kinase